ncbi:MAG: hypothetical protein QNJ68_11945 [Microcoleaceae cyanobacterium MO_207.B10]|nr:hypothetical protein [Microcoleaceae cyanobacterium MO_207.B10]
MTLFFMLLFALPSLKWVKQIFPSNNFAKDTSLREQSKRNFYESQTQ